MRRQVLLELCAAAALAACGGAGEAPSSSSTAGPPPVEPPPTPTPTPPAAPLPAPAVQPVAALPAGHQLAWQDEFDGASLDATRWHAAARPRGHALDTPAAISVQGGVLRITTSTEAGRHETGFLSTDGLYEPTRGYFEARLRFLGAPGQWCAFWLMSPTIGVPLGDPARAGAEIDVVEHRVVDESGWQLADWVGQNVLWDGYGPQRKNVHHVAPAPGGARVNGEWHTFAVLWDEQGYTFYVDAAPVWSTGAAVSERGEYLLLSCEVLDGDWAGFVPPGGYGPRASSAIGMEVDWVRVWQRPP